MKKIVDSQPEQETPKIEERSKPEMKVEPGGGEKPITKKTDNTTLIIVIIVIVVIIGFMIYLNMQKNKANATGTTDSGNANA